MLGCGTLVVFVAGVCVVEFGSNGCGVDLRPSGRAWDVGSIPGWAVIKLPIGLLVLPRILVPKWGFSRSRLVIETETDKLPKSKMK